MVEDECKAKLGSASNTICSFNNSTVNRCDSTTVSPQVTTSINSSFSPTTTYQNTSTSHGYNRPHRLSEGQDSNFWRAFSVSLLVVTGVAIVAYNYRSFSSRRWCFLRRKNHDQVEMGTELVKSCHVHVMEPHIVQSSKGNDDFKFPLKFVCFAFLFFLKYYV